MYSMYMCSMCQGYTHLTATESGIGYRSTRYQFIQHHSIRPAREREGGREGERGRGEGEWERGEERGGGREKSNKRRGEINRSLIIIINQLQASRGCVNERSSTPPYHNKSQQTRPPMAIFTTTKFSLRLHNLPTGMLSTVHQVTNTFCAHHLFMVCQYYLSQMGGGVHT